MTRTPTGLNVPPQKHTVNSVDVFLQKKLKDENIFLQFTTFSILVTRSKAISLIVRIETVVVCLLNMEGGRVLTLAHLLKQLIVQQIIMTPASQLPR